LGAPGKDKRGEAENQKNGGSRLAHASDYSVDGGWAVDAQE
jgi:hypothetical protein